MEDHKHNIYDKIMTARLLFLESNPKKTGKNSFQNFNYFELSDIIPAATRICNNLGLYTEINLTSKMATMKVVNIDDPKEIILYHLPVPEINGKDSNKLLQDTGKTETYLRRYLYLLFLDIAVPDEVDSQDMNKNKRIRTRPRGRRADPDEGGVI